MVRRREMIAQSHVNKAVFWLEDTVWPTTVAAPRWQDRNQRWQLTQIAWIIIHARLVGNRAQCVRLSTVIPPFIRSEVAKQYEELCEIDRCPLCGLPLIDNFANEATHE